MKLTKDNNDAMFIHHTYNYMKYMKYMKSRVYTTREGLLVRVLGCTISGPYVFNTTCGAYTLQGHYVYSCQGIHNHRKDLMDFPIGRPYTARLRIAMLLQRFINHA